MAQPQPRSEEVRRQLARAACLCSCLQRLMQDLEVFRLGSGSGSSSGGLMQEADLADADIVLTTF